MSVYVVLISAAKMASSKDITRSFSKEHYPIYVFYITIIFNM